MTLILFFVLIDSTDVVDSNLKLILGLVWTLILHYSISTVSNQIMKEDDTLKSKTIKLLFSFKSSLYGKVKKKSLMKRVIKRKRHLNIDYSDGLIISYLN